MRIPKRVAADQFGYDKDDINITDATDASQWESQVLLGKSKVYSSQLGFQSTSLEKDEALDFAKPPEDDSQIGFVSILLKIEIKSNMNFFIYDENTHAFPHEKEALFQEGLEFKIIEKNRIKH